MRWIVATSLRYRYLVVFLAVVLMIFSFALLVGINLLERWSSRYQH